MKCEAVPLRSASLSILYKNFLSYVFVFLLYNFFLISYVFIFLSYVPSVGCYLYHICNFKLSCISLL